MRKTIPTLAIAAALAAPAPADAHTLSISAARRVANGVASKLLRDPDCSEFNESWIGSCNRINAHRVRCNWWTVTTDGVKCGVDLTVRYTSRIYRRAAWDGNVTGCWRD